MHLYVIQNQIPIRLVSLKIAAHSFSQGIRRGPRRKKKATLGKSA